MHSCTSIPLKADYTSIVPYYRFPDAAVADNGITYLVWHYMDHNGYYYDCWNYIAADNSVPNASVILYRMKHSFHLRIVIQRWLLMAMLPLLSMRFMAAARTACITDN